MYLFKSKNGQKRFPLLSFSVVARDLCSWVCEETGTLSFRFFFVDRNEYYVARCEVVREREKCEES